MKLISTKELQRMLSLYLDGALDEEARNRFEEYLASHPDAASELQRLEETAAVVEIETGSSAERMVLAKTLHPA
jgi:anti-sigma factor RsiW